MKSSSENSLYVQVYDLTLMFWKKMIVAVVASNECEKCIFLYNKKGKI